MARKQNPYTRLPGIGRGLVSYNRLYLGTDHLLAVDSNYLSEDYKRFYYKDIQAVITRKTQKGMIQNICLMIIYLLFLLSAFRSGGGWGVFFFIMAGIFFIFLLVNWFRGPTCISYVMTPVQTVRLFPLNRIKNTKRAMARVKPLIESAQGPISREALKTFSGGVVDG